jgi:hypothetical protein
MKFRIVTPSSRSANLPAVLASIEAGAPLDVEWWIYHDTELSIIPVVSEKIHVENRRCLMGSGWGAAARNVFLDEVGEDCWIYFLDDDNLLYPGFWKKITYLIYNFPAIGMFIVAQERGRGNFPAVNISRCYVDMAQAVFRGSFIGNERFAMHYEADGDLIVRLHDKEPSRVHVDRTVLCYYNRLRWPEPL